MTNIILGKIPTTIPVSVLLDDTSENVLSTSDTSSGSHPEVLDLPELPRRSERVRKPVDRLDL